ncbi:MAG: histidine triad nucleotide-binding protein [Candidatus Andersenbacteria bacterium]
MTEGSTIFSQIIDGTTPADIVYDGGDTLFFRDIAPKAPVHIVAITKKAISSLQDMTEEDTVLLGKLMHDITTVADAQGLKEGGYRVITNVGNDAGQEVKHLHFHILGGEPLGPLRCQ